MKKVILQGIITVILFFLIWFSLTQIDWVSLFKVEQVTNKTEEKLGDLLWDILEKEGTELKDPFVVKSVDSIVNKICIANNLDRKTIKVHILENEEVNAFAMPNSHLVVYSALILHSDNQEELTGVICHEIAHLQLNHVMKKLVKEIGLSALISITTGNGGGQVIKETAKLLSSSAFDRNLEKEADIKAVDYLLKAKIDPKPFANFLFKLADTENEATKYLSWISTHPDSKERAEYILEYSKEKKIDYESVLSAETWKRLREQLLK